MMGRNHLIAGTAAAGAAAFWVAEPRDQRSGVAQLFDEKLSWLLHLWPSWLGGLDGAAGSPGWAVLPVSSIAERLGSWVLPVDLFSVWGAVYAFLAVGMFWFGSVLPDIDSKGSILGRMIRVPGPHHGVTHTDWFLGLLFLASLPSFTRVLFWLWLGAALHCWLDGLSQSGRVRFYPLGRYTIRSLPNGGGACVVASGNRLRFYHVGELSEMVALLGILGLSVASVLFMKLI